MPDHLEIPESAREFLSSFGVVWKIESLENTVTVKFSGKMVHSLGNCRPEAALIRLNKVLLDVRNEKILREILCHEAAHAAVFILYGKKCKPHGPEWRSLLLAAGYPPRTRIPGNEVHGLLRIRRKSRYLYTHRCMNCGAIFRAKKTDHRWRCKNCLVKGLEGSLTLVNRVPV